MSAALFRLHDVLQHGCGQEKVVIADQTKFRITIRCGCGMEWHWGLFSELKRRLPEGYVEEYFQDDEKRRKLSALVNGVLVVMDEKELK